MSTIDTEPIEPESESEWRIFLGNAKPHDEIVPGAPPWRRFKGKPPRLERMPRPQTLTAEFEIDYEETELVNAALFLRRPLLVTGKPGIGKSTLAYAVAHELNLGEVLVWPINTRSTLQEGLYRYDAIGRLQDEKFNEGAGSSAKNIGRYVKLGALGTAFLPSSRPRVLLIDEIDKSDIDLPNDLLNIFEQGGFEIPELSRLPSGQDDVEVQPSDAKSREENDGVDDTVAIHRGHVEVHAFPFIVMTSNGEREFPGPFLRRCIRLEMQPPGAAKLTRIVKAHLGDEAAAAAETLIADFVERGQKGEDLATDQLLNAVFLKNKHHLRLEKEGGRESLRKAIIHALNLAT